MNIYDIFTLTANQEKEHASWLFKMIQDIKGNSKSLDVLGESPFTLGDTKNNLKAAIDGEVYERDTMYPEFAKIARDEGYNDIARRLELIAVAENHHAERYQKLLKVLEDWINI